jgi:GTP-binding protein HflX
MNHNRPMLSERAVLVGVGSDRARVAESLDELAGLVLAAGGEVVGQLMQVHRDPGLGPGKLRELKALIEASDAAVAVYDGELAPVAARHWEDVLECRVVDRSQVILDIFAQRAHSVEGRLQVEMAQLAYLLPRLRGEAGHLSRTGGGIGTRGPGETRLESDRRRIRQRMAWLARELARVEAERAERRERRRRAGVPVVALVGYTNVGKSTLFQALARRWAPSDDALFVTLDPMVRRIHLPGYGPTLLADTVGFVARLPVALVAAFRSTLDEVRDAEVLVEVHNAASARPDFERAAVSQVLKDLGVADKPRVVVETQWDRVAPSREPDGIAVSGRTGYHLDALAAALADQLRMARPATTVTVPWDAGEVLGWIAGEGAIVETHGAEDGLQVVFSAPAHVRARVLARLASAAPLPPRRG